MPSKDAPKQLKQDRLVEQLIPDPGAHTPTIQLTGWLGKGTQEGTWRLYLTPRLDEYVQFSDKDVVHTQPLQPDQSPLGGTMVWLQGGTVLQHTQIVGRQVQADFLSGAVASGLMPGAPAAVQTAAALKGAPAGNTRGYQCSVNQHIPACQIRTDVCGINSGDLTCASGAFCPTREFVCGGTVGCTVGRECSVGC
ncbi:MAG TPA: hypothetical protein VG675_22145 [Bryobacteraceae bacterium]|nr:hypothetical protein [Bryobacteraceae bacterium]